MKYAAETRSLDSYPDVLVWKERDKFEVRLAELERIVANQADIIHMLVQSTTMLLKAANGKKD